MPDALLYDNHNRPLNYVRLAVTDRCNLRCFYCMPAEGIEYVPRKELLSYEEMLRLLSVLAEMGISKVRFTGGEPFLRKDLMPFLWQVRAIPGIRDMHLTTNGVLTGSYISELKEMGIASVNLSLDTLDRERFHQITRRDELPKVMNCLYALLENGIETKLNAVVMEGKNTADILPMVAFTRQHPVNIRFIEEMPFNGDGAQVPGLNWNHRRILQEIHAQYPDLEKIEDGPNSTSMNYRVPGFAGSFGIIAAFTRTFCGTCNRIRLTARGTLKTCLYDQGVLDVKALLRSGATDEALRQAFLKAFASRARDGYEAERQRDADRPVTESMSTIGG
jgi:molybdenum cofactor biosynthesis protein A